jgi:hypothetical protein
VGKKYVVCSLRIGGEGSTECPLTGKVSQLPFWERGQVIDGDALEALMEGNVKRLVAAGALREARPWEASQERVEVSDPTTLVPHRVEDQQSENARLRETVARLEGELEKAYREGRHNGGAG